MKTGPPSTPTIHRATATDVDSVTSILVNAFLHGDLATWLVPDLDARRRIYPAYFAIITGYFLDAGIVEITDDHAAALWVHLDGRFEPDIPDYEQRLAQACGNHVEQFVQLDQAMHEAHPTEVPHAYLAFLAVRPSHQARGYGSALLRHHHAFADALGLPAYLEATGERNARLYARHGYAVGTPYQVAGSSSALQPMWREPAPANASTTEYPTELAAALGTPVATTQSATPVNPSDLTDESHDHDHC